MLVDNERCVYIMTRDGYEPGQLKFGLIEGDSNRPVKSYVNVTPDMIENIDTSGEAPTLKKRRGRPKKGEREEDVLARNADQAARELAPIGPNTIMTTENPIIDRYGETNAMLHHTIAQTDQLAHELKADLDNIRTMKSTSLSAKTKYEAIGTIGSTIGNLLRTKISAVQELNKTLSDTNKMEISRFKEIGDRNAEKSNEERIMELYNAYINMPVGQVQGPTFIPMEQAVVGQAPVIAIGQAPQNMPVTPEMNRILLENNPNIETILVHDPTTGTNHFDVIDKSTGQSVPNYPRPGQMVLEGIDVKPNQGIAINRSLNQEFPLVVQPSMPDVVHSTDPNMNQVLQDMGMVSETKKKGIASTF